MLWQPTYQPHQEDVMDTPPSQPLWSIVQTAPGAAGGVIAPDQQAEAAQDLRNAQIRDVGGFAVRQTVETSQPR